MDNEEVEEKEETEVGTDSSENEPQQDTTLEETLPNEVISEPETHIETSAVNEEVDQNATTNEPSDKETADSKSTENFAKDDEVVDQRDSPGTINEEGIPKPEQIGYEEEDKQLSIKEQLSKESLTRTPDEKEPEGTAVGLTEDEAEVEKEWNEDESDAEHDIAIINPSFNRDEYIEKYKEYQQERSSLSLLNTVLHRKVLDHFRKKKITQIPKDESMEPAEAEKKYQSFLFTYETYKTETELKENKIKQDLENIKNDRDEKLNNFLKEFRLFQQLEKSTGKGLSFATSGLKLNNDFIEKKLSKQFKKMEELADIELKFIKVKNVLTKAESNLQDVEKLDEGLQVRDFEKLQADNENFMKKLEERENELRKQINLCSEYHEKVAHMKEELQCEMENCDEAQANLEIVQLEYNKTREKFSVTKNQLKQLQVKLHGEKKASGLLAYPKLHDDFKKTKWTVNKLKNERDILLQDVQKHRLTFQKIKKAVHHKENQISKRMTIKPKIHRSVVFC